MRRRDLRNELVPCGLRNHEFAYPEYVGLALMLGSTF